MSVIIETKKITRNYGGVPAIKDVSFTVEKGEIVGFVGLNGAGKSTTINLLLGLQSPSEGEVVLFGEKVTLPNAYKSHRRIGFVNGDMALFDSMTGEQYLRFVAKLYGIRKEAPAYGRLVELFKPQLNKKIKQLSRGNKQKIALIAAFMTEPELVILDEPSSGLDPLMQQVFLDLVRSEAEKGTTIFMSSHYLAEIADVCSRILLIKGGVIIKDMLSAELEHGSGKFVTVVTKNKVHPPASAKNVRIVEREDKLIELKFIYEGTVMSLQAWLSSLPLLQDIIIKEHDPQAAFKDLYTAQEDTNV